MMSKVLLEELSSWKAQKKEEEQFPNLLLSSLDKLFEDKQQQLWLVCKVDQPGASTNYLHLDHTCNTGLNCRSRT